MRFKGSRHFFYFNEALFYCVKRLQGLALLKIALRRLSTTCYKEVHASLTLVRCVLLMTHDDV